MIVGGPNARKDYHYNETEELFYQLEGHIQVIIQEDGERKVMELGPGDMYLHPGKVPHSPARGDNSIGLVIERKRAGTGYTDGLLWFCDNCNHKIHEVYFELLDVENQAFLRFHGFHASRELRGGPQDLSLHHFTFLLSIVLSSDGALGPEGWP